MPADSSTLAGVDSAMKKSALLILLLLGFHSVKAQKAGTARTFDVFEGMELEMVWIPAGTFEMGNCSGVEDRWSHYETPHEVTLSEGFWMAKLEVTQPLWLTVMGQNPSSKKGDNYPVTDISWHQAMAFVETIQRFDPKFDLPTEAQWEHAAKAGTNEAYSLPRDEITWHKDNSGVELHEVGTKKPNLWGLHDIHGNAGEWVKDWRAPFDNKAQKDPAGPETGERKLIKGGQFTGRPRHTQSFDRQSAPADGKYFFVGLRLIRRQ